MSLSNSDCICYPHVFNKNSGGGMSLLEGCVHNFFCQATQQEAEVAATCSLTVRGNHTTAVSPRFPHSSLYCFQEIRERCKEESQGWRSRSCQMMLFHSIQLNAVLCIVQNNEPIIRLQCKNPHHRLIFRKFGSIKEVYISVTKVTMNTYPPRLTWFWSD